MNNLNDYDYNLPEELIAKEPLQQRDASRLFVFNRKSGKVDHCTIGDLLELLHPGDCLVLNDTQVLPARLLGIRTATGGRWEGLYLGCNDSGVWQLIGRTRGKLKRGEQIAVHRAHDFESPDQLNLTLLECNADGLWLARADRDDDVLALLKCFGTVPLPPYIRRQLATSTDWQRYQTLYARHPGSVAAPTAGLHFTDELLAACQQHGIQHVWITLHIGIDTFRPIATDKLSEHRMHSEWCELSVETAEKLNSTRSQGGRIVAVGTTTVRTLETAVADNRLNAWRGKTDLFIHPPYRFQIVDCLLTNFHLPRSSLFVLVCAFAGTASLQQAYATAAQNKYRFYSYGDAMLIL